MHFLNTRFSQDATLSTFDNPPEQQETFTENQQSETHHNASDDDLITPTTGRLRSKFWRFETLLNTEPPEMLYENEAWAPKYEGIGVFRKHRMNVE